MQNYFGRAQKPVRVMDRIRTLLITCEELEHLPEWTIRQHLGPYTVMRTPGALLQSSDLAKLETVLTDNSCIRHIVVCLHSLCSRLWGKTTSHLKTPTKRQHVNLNTDYKKALWQQQWLRNKLPYIRHWLRTINREDVEVHGWIYELETDWITALDTDDDFFVPLNGHTHFYKNSLICN